MGFNCETGKRNENKSFQGLCLNGQPFKIGMKIHIMDNKWFIGLAWRRY